MRNTLNLVENELINFFLVLSMIAHGRQLSLAPLLHSLFSTFHLRDYISMHTSCASKYVRGNTTQ